MIVERIGYKKISDLEKLNHFSIYETNKKTNILILDTSINRDFLYYPKYDRLPWKIIEGKKITSIKKIFESNIDSIENIDFSKWNNGNQIMSYKEFTTL